MCNIKLEINNKQTLRQIFKFEIRLLLSHLQKLCKNGQIPLLFDQLLGNCRIRSS